MSKVFLVDSSYLIALKMANDQNHIRASHHWQSLRNQSPTLMTTSYILDETVTFLNSRGHHQHAVQTGELLLSSGSFNFVHVEEFLFREGWDYFKQFGDKRFSLTDCISFVVMKQFEMDTAFTFDQHFVQAGFKTTPD